MAVALVAQRLDPLDPLVVSALLGGRIHGPHLAVIVHLLVDLARPFCADGPAHPPTHRATDVRVSVVVLHVGDVLLPAARALVRAHGRHGPDHMVVGAVLVAATHYQGDGED